MPRISLITLLHEHAEFARGLCKLVKSGAHDEAEYVTAIMQTDMAEFGCTPPGSTWPRSGDVPPAGWTVYDAAVRWGQGGCQT
ncbi:MAG TPA: hypothetical protein VHL31_19005 [Geminicoccus sp.]|jgi:hypothetical protein|uniref:hypothetical protein n=1 Tax=Geminicoccus sp. TaxID=2024832 RepID=UPI002E303A7F|nr:hypothetical protein [Geminicoccus sp.]HEX2528377.1 hypothetical protein [Geminicoccus sp.]